MTKVYETLNKYILADKDALVIDLDKSHGSWVVDTTGKERLDLFSQFASQPLGWNHYKVNAQRDKLYRVALHNIANSDCYTDEYAEFVEKFATSSPDFKHFFFIAGGTLGVENALKAAFDYKAQKIGTDEGLDVIHFTRAFHGRSGYTLSLTNTSPDKTDLYPKFKWTRCPIPQGNVTEQQSLDAVHHRLRSYDRVAAIIIESIQGEGGDNHFEPHFMQELRHLADQYDVMLIMDEVQTGVGLTGKMWAYEHYGIVPDMIAFGKKAQVCGFASTGRIDKVEKNVFTVPSRINSTWGGNLVDMVRSGIYLDIIREDKLIENAATVGNYLMEKLGKLGLDNLRGRGLMIAFSFKSADERNKYLDRLKDNAVAMGCGTSSVRLRPHLTFSQQDADAAVEFIKKAL